MKERLTPDLIAREGALVDKAISRVQWSPDGRRLAFVKPHPTEEEADSLWLYELATGERTPLYDPKASEEKLSADSYQWSPRGDCLLMEGEKDLWLLEVATARRRRLTKDLEEESAASFSPDGARVAFVKGGNLFALELDTGLLERLTEDGGGPVLNGKLDWVYEEELASRRSGRAYEWSPDGRRIVYLRLDGDRVPEYPLVDYLAVHPQVRPQRYPKAGDPNPLPSLHAVTVGDRETQRFAEPLAPGVEYVVPVFSWTPDSRSVAFLTLNRDQTELALRLWSPGAAKSRVLLVERDPCWINADALDPPCFLGHGDRFLWLSERDGWFHLYLYDRRGELLNRLTEGEWMVDPQALTPTGRRYQVSETDRRVYFVGTREDPRQRHVYRVPLEGGPVERVTTEAGSHGLSLSPDGAYIVDAFSTADRPAVTRLLTADGCPAAVLDEPASRLDRYETARTDLVELSAPDGTRLFGRLARPAELKPGRRYPVVVNVYGGPHAQVVRDRWGVTSLTDHLLVQEGFLVWSLDNRGSWGRGHAWESVVFRNLGEQELKDQLLGVEYLKSLPFVDPERLGIQGWSYGGYMTLYALTHAPEVFRCGVAGAPVTDWRLYDTIYTERYLRTPEANPEGYRAASPVNAADRLQARLLLVHGAADDNVHLQNTLSFVAALTKARLPYELQIQPDQKHGFKGETPRAFLTQQVLGFLKRHLLEERREPPLATRGPGGGREEGRMP